MRFVKSAKCFLRFLLEIHNGETPLSRKEGFPMSENRFFPRFHALCRSYGTSPNAVAKALGIPSGSVTAWKNGSIPRSATLQKLADYFGVTVDSLLGTEPSFSEEMLKYALFGGDGPITDKMLEEVLQFAQFVKHRNQ